MMEFYDIEATWKGFTIVLKSDTLDSVRRELTEKNIIYNDTEDPTILRITNQEKLLLFEIEFLTVQQSTMKDFFEKIFKSASLNLEKKINNIETLIYYDKEKKELKNIDYQNRFIGYREHIDNNIIDTGVIEEDRIKVNPEFWLLLLDIYKENEVCTTEIKVIENLFLISILLLIFEKTTISLNDDKKSHDWIFNMHSNKRKNSTKVNWNEILTGLEQFGDISDIKGVYDWIKAEDMFETKIQIIRNYIIKSDGIVFSQDMLLSIKSMYKIVILQQTDIYFEQQNKLLDVLVDIKKDEIKKNNELLTKILALVTTFGLGLYGKILSSSNTKDSIVKILNSDGTLVFLLSLFLICIIFLTLSYYLSFKDKKDYLTKLKYIYKMKYQIEEENFTFIEKEVELFQKSKWKYWITLIVIICSVVIILMYCIFDSKVTEVLYCISILFKIILWVQFTVC